jgi:hypothetical protein
MRRFAVIQNLRSSTCFGEITLRVSNAQRTVLDSLQRSAALCLLSIDLRLTALVVDAPALRFTPKANFVRQARHR